MTIANKSDTLDKKVLNDLKSVAKGNMSAVDLYLSASDATDQQDELRQEADNLVVQSLNTC